MDMSMEKLEGFTSVIMADAMAESTRIYDDIKRESQSILSAAEDEALAETFRYIKNEIAKIHSDCGRKLSRKLMENKRELYTRRERMADEVMDAVRTKLEEYVKTPVYRKQMKAILKRTLDVFSADTTVWLREEDMDMVPELVALAGKHTVTFQTGRFELGGFEAACPARKKQADETFDTTMHELRSHFSELFGIELSE